ncbi:MULTISPECIES: SDR family NAD(P)-dependent oxidoreductase [Halorussus]|uniref:SDR family NAD(P)-dependent oxidoreductase n=1 Tax=Halorussus TaxID=1070314 RepID=UPI00209FBE6D|nr:SDR family NAD(P)-dependent oxidoreductase [Halorussus vallis]USZ76402.1 SDR family NAD(P)-dependent oxidoreductase [Halorussus vallis]
MTKRAIVVGASSGIGAALARELAAEGYEVGLVARRLDRLKALGEELPTKSYVARIDVAETEEAMDRLRRLLDAMHGADLIVLNAGVGIENEALDWEPERQTIDVNVRGFAAMANVAMRHFEERGAGHLVGVSSVAGRFGNGAVPAYSASKAFVSNYLDGLRYRAAGRDAEVVVADMIPGYVDTEMATNEGRFWEVSAEVAAAQIAAAIRKEKARAYVPRRWRAVALFLDAMPDAFFRRLFA